MRNLVILAILLLLSGNVFAQEPTRVAVVDMQKLIDSSTAAIDINAQAKKEHDQYQAAISKEEDSLRKEDAKLQEQRSLLTAEVYAEKSRKFKDKVTKAQRSFQEKMVARDEVIKKSFEQIRQATIEIIDSLAQEEGFDITIPKAQTLYATQKLDITDKVLERLNMKLPKLEPLKNSNNKEDASNKNNKKSKNISKQ